MSFMNSNPFKRIAGMASALVLLSALSAGAVTITVGATPTASVANPFATSTSGPGTVFENISGSVPALYRSPWEGTSVDVATGLFTSVSGNSEATYVFSRATSVSFLWGSPDIYNDFDIILSGGGGVETVNGISISPPLGIGQQYVTLSDVGIFSSVTFRSGLNAFEFANLTTTPVPLPAAAPLLLAGVGALSILRRRRKAA
jgi:hypothetical protein